MARKAEITLEFLNYIERPPAPPESLYRQACSNDEITITSWRKTWINNVKKNHEKFKSFKENGLGKLFGSFELKPCIIAGSGPSLKYNAHLLKDRGNIPLVSCLHNYQFLEDLGVEPDYYVTLDAGDVVIEEVYEGGKRAEQEYWDSTKNKKLIAFIGTSPRLFEKWQGEIYFYNAPVPDEAYRKETSAFEEFNTYVSNGGNVLGACLYIAKGIFGANPIAFVGADFSFSYDKKFHAWDSKYDEKLGVCARTNDVYGNKVFTWSSYMNFKSWFDFVAVQVPGIYINCTEGGTFGAYPEGNIMQVKQMELDSFLNMYKLHKIIEGQSKNPENPDNRVLF